MDLEFEISGFIMKNILGEGSESLLMVVAEDLFGAKMFLFDPKVGKNLLTSLTQPCSSQLVQIDEETLLDTDYTSNFVALRIEKSAKNDKLVLSKEVLKNLPKSKGNAYRLEDKNLFCFLQADAKQIHFLEITCKK